jgi:RES domain-containing protein
MDLAALRKLTPVMVTSTLARCVPRDSLETHLPVDFLYTSGKAGRYNPAGLNCIYFSENAVVAVREHERRMSTLPGLIRPFVTYYAEVNLPVLDLEDAAVLKALNLEESDLFSPWPKSLGSASKTQRLGEVVSLQKEFAAIRFPSDAAHRAHETGFNFVIYPSSIKAPARLKIETGAISPSQAWP